MRKYLDAKEREIEVAKPNLVIHDVVKPEDDDAEDNADAEDHGIKLKPPSSLTKAMTDVTPPEDAEEPKSSPDSVPVSSDQPEVLTEDKPDVVAEKPAHTPVGRSKFARRSDIRCPDHWDPTLRAGLPESVK